MTNDLMHANDLEDFTQPDPHLVSRAAQHTLSDAQQVERLVGEQIFHIGLALREARLDKGLTQAQLAKLAGVSLRTVHNVELATAGDGARLMTILKLFRFCGIRADCRLSPIADKGRGYADEEIEAQALPTIRDEPGQGGQLIQHAFSGGKTG